MISATITGRLTEDPTRRFTTEGTPVANLRLASDSRDGDTTSFLDPTIWGTRGESAAEHLVQGQHITATGTLESSNWTDDEGTTPTSWKLEITHSEWHSKPRSQEPVPAAAG